MQRTEVLRKLDEAAGDLDDAHRAYIEALEGIIEAVGEQPAHALLAKLDILRRDMQGLSAQIKRGAAHG